MPTTTVRYLDQTGSVELGSLDERRPLADGSWVWVDVQDADDDTRSKLAEHFDLHPLSLEDTDHPQVRAKLDVFPDQLFIVWLTPTRPAQGKILVDELDVFLGKQYLVTMHAGPNKAIEAVASGSARAMKGGPDWALHAIIDLLVDSALPLVDEIGDRLDQLEDDIIDTPDQTMLRKLHHLRRELTQLRRIAAPERDVLRALVRDSDFVDQEAYRYFLDVGDHVARLMDSIETWQDVAASVMDVYLSAQNNRMNQIMKQLTVVATIFMPLTLLSGIYGMNTIAGMWPPAGLIPEGGTQWAFWAIVGSMIVIAASMMAWFRRKNWW